MADGARLTLMLSQPVFSVISCMWRPPGPMIRPILGMGTCTCMLQSGNPRISPSHIIYSTFYTASQIRYSIPEESLQGKHLGHIQA